MTCDIRAETDGQTNEHTHQHCDQLVSVADSVRMIQRLLRAERPDGADTADVPPIGSSRSRCHFRHFLKEVTERRELVEVENLLVRVGSIGSVPEARGPATSRDLECGAYEITDRLTPFNTRNPMLGKVYRIGGTKHLNLKLVSTLRPCQLFRLNLIRVLGETRAAIAAKSPCIYWPKVSPGAPCPLTSKSSKLLGVM